MPFDFLEETSDDPYIKCKCDVCDEEIYICDDVLAKDGIRMHKDCFQAWLEDQETEELAENLGFETYI